MDDEVDELVAAWRRELPDLPVSAMGIWSRIARLSWLLDRARRSACQTRGLEVWEFDVLAALRRASGGSLGAGELSRQTHVTTGTMTNRIDRLTTRGLIHRERGLSDRRSVLLVLSQSGRELVDGAMTDLLAAEEALLGDMDVASRERLTGDLRALLLSQD